MGKGYGTYWLVALGIGLPILVASVWRIVVRFQTEDSPGEGAVTSLELLIALVGGAALLLLLIALPFDVPLIRARRHGGRSRHFLVRRNSELSAALDSAEEESGAPRLSWPYWVLVDVSEEGVRLRSRAQDAASGWWIPHDDIRSIGLGESKVNALPAPALVIALDHTTLPFVPSSGAFLYAWGAKKIESEVEEIRQLWGGVKTAR